jgi:CTP:molybdopterin cytidylyltransferase MocA
MEPKEAEERGPDEVVTVILAAGAGRRLGGVAKALLDGGGASFLARVAASAAAGGAGRGVVVVGAPHGERVAAEAGRLGLEVATNPTPERGMASSVAIGFEHAASRFGRARAGLLWPVDHAAVDSATVARLVDEARADLILVPVWRGRGGHPTAFGRELWPDLVACGELPRGARSVIERRAERVRRIDVGDGAIAADVDRPGDLG